MSHNEWQEMIPFYVAGTLTEVEKLDFEKHLTGCYTCKEELLEWQSIAESTFRKAQEWSRELPPLSPFVRSNLIFKSAVTSPNGARSSTVMRFRVPNTLQINHVRKSRFPITLVASVIMALLFVSLLALATHPQTKDESASQIGSDLDTLQTGVFMTNTIAFTATDIPTSTLVPTTLPTPTHVPGVNSNNPVFVSTAVTITNTPNPTRMPPSGICSVGTLNDNSVNVYRWAGTQYEVTNILPIGEFWRTVIFDDNGWYQVVAPEGGIAGWVSGEDVLLYGSCDGLITSTPTVPANTCLLRQPADNSRVSLYVYPDETSEILAILESFDASTIVLGRNGEWYQVRYNLLDSVWIGWVYGDSVLTYGYCSALQTIDVGEKSPEVILFETNVENIPPGETIELRWEVQYADEVSIAYYGIGVDPSVEGFEPDGRYDHLLLSGSLDVSIPFDYEYSGIEFALILNDAEIGDPNLMRFAVIIQAANSEATEES